MLPELSRPKNLLRLGRIVACALISFAALSGQARAQTSEQEYRANLQIRLMEMENQMRRMTGQYEEAVHRLAQLTRRLELALEDVEFRLQSLEQGNVGASSAPASGAPAAVLPSAQAPAPEAAPPVVETAAVPEDDPDQFLVGETPEAQFQEAFKFVRKEQLLEAESAFRAFIAKYPDHELTANARYWLGKSYFERSDFNRAARTLLETYEKHAESTKGPDILLYLALSLNALGQKADACVALADLSSQYPNASPVIQDRAAKGRRDAACN